MALKPQIIGGNHAGDGGSFRLKIDRDEIRWSLAAAYRPNPTTVKHRPPTPFVTSSSKRCAVCRF